MSSVRQSILNLLATLVPFYNRESAEGDDVIQELDDVGEAVSRSFSVEDEYEALVGEPRVEDVQPYINGQRIVLPVGDIPFTSEDETALALSSSQFSALMDYLGVEEVEEVEGSSVPLAYTGEEVVVNWAEVTSGVARSVADEIEEVGDDNDAADVVAGVLDSAAYALTDEEVSQLEAVIDFLEDRELDADDGSPDTLDLETRSVSTELDNVTESEQGDEQSAEVETGD